MLTWQITYETGVPSVDAQHRVLFNHLNRLERLLAKSAIEPAEAGYLLRFLERYAAKHFCYEEDCMAQHHCPVHEQNKTEHAQFLKVLKFCRDEYLDTAAPREALERLHATAVWWLKNHILRIDIHLKHCVARHAAC